MKVFTIAVAFGLVGSAYAGEIPKFAHDLVSKKIVVSNCACLRDSVSVKDCKLDAKVLRFEGPNGLSTYTLTFNSQRGEQISLEMNADAMNKTDHSPANGEKDTTSHDYAVLYSDSRAITTEAYLSRSSSDVLVYKQPSGAGFDNSFETDYQIMKLEDGKLKINATWTSGDSAHLDVTPHVQTIDSVACDARLE